MTHLTSYHLTYHMTSITLVITFFICSPDLSETALTVCLGSFAFSLFSLEPQPVLKSFLKNPPMDSCSVCCVADTGPVATGSPFDFGDAGEMAPLLLNLAGAVCDNDFFVSLVVLVEGFRVTCSGFGCT